MADTIHKPLCRERRHQLTREDRCAGGKAGVGTAKARTREQCQAAVRERERRRQGAREAENAARLERLRRLLR